MSEPTRGEPGQAGQEGHDGRGGIGGTGGTGGAGGDPSGTGGPGGPGGTGGTGSEFRRRWIFRLGLMAAAVLLAASLLYDRVKSNNQLDYLRSQASRQDVLSLCRSKIASDLDVALAEFNLADGRVDLLITDGITALIANDRPRLITVGEAIAAANAVALEKADALAEASARRNATGAICPSPDD